MCYNRPDYLERTLKSLMSVPLPQGFKLYISEDGTDPRVAAVGRSHPQFTLMQHPRDEKRLEGNMPMNAIQGPPVYYRISAHYKFAFTQVIDMHHHDYIVFVEDDMEISNDFYTYFQATLPIIDTDRTVWAVSSWNDNGQDRFVSDARELVRADFFPGLGWGTSRSIWNELSMTWPGGHWDDWLREPPQRRNRVTIRPEISRTKNFGAHGASDGQFFDQYIASVKLNMQAVNWGAEDLSYLVKDSYDQIFLRAVGSATRINDLAEIRGGVIQDYRIEYPSLKEYERMAQQNGLMPDSKAGVPRCGYLNIVTIKVNGNRIFYSPPLAQLPIPPPVRL